jgi:hypothetical protein
VRQTRDCLSKSLPDKRYERERGREREREKEEEENGCRVSFFTVERNIEMACICCYYCHRLDE